MRDGEVVPPKFGGGLPGLGVNKTVESASRHPRCSVGGVRSSWMRRGGQRLGLGLELDD
jgi:hypothetical protein